MRSIPWYRRPNHSRVHVILTLREQQGASYQKIASAMHISPETARKALRILAPTSHRLLTMREVLRLTKIKPWIVYHLCRKNLVPHTRSSTRHTGTYHIDSRDISLLEREAKKMRRGVCRICKRIFVFRQQKATVCYRASCQKKRKLGNYTALCTRPERMLPRLLWQKMIQRAVRNRSHPPGPWLMINDVLAAIKHTLSRTQLWWLGIRNIIHRKPHPTKRWREKPITLYSLHEVRIAARMFRRYGNA